jgi:hypothetical protein
VRPTAHRSPTPAHARRSPPPPRRPPRRTGRRLRGVDRYRRSTPCEPRRNPARRVPPPPRSSPPAAHPGPYSASSSLPLDHQTPPAVIVARVWAAQLSRDPHRPTRPIGPASLRQTLTRNRNTHPEIMRRRRPGLRAAPAIALVGPADCHDPLPAADPDSQPEPELGMHPRPMTSISCRADAYGRSLHDAALSACLHQVR